MRAWVPAVGLVAQRKQWDVNGAGATAVSKLLDRSQLKQDAFAEQSAMTHCGILQTYTDLLSGPHSDDKTRQIFERCSSALLLAFKLFQCDTCFKDMPLHSCTIAQPPCAASIPYYAC